MTQALHRSFDVPELELTRAAGGKRMVTALIVPWNRPTRIVERTASGSVIDYSEQFAPGSLDRASSAPHRVPFQIDHDDRLEREAGYGAAFRNSAEGCVGEFLLYDNVPGGVARTVELLESSRRGVSVTFRSLAPRMGTETDGALVTRTAVHLSAVAAVADPAYADAGVLAIRAEHDAELELATRLRADRELMLSTLTFLRANGVPFAPEHTAWLAAEHIDPATLAPAT